MSAAQQDKDSIWRASAILLLAFFSLTTQARGMQVPHPSHLVFHYTAGVAAPRPTSTLLRRARPVARFRLGEVRHTYQWLSPHTLLIVHAVYDSSHIEAEVVNTITRTRRPLKGVNAFFDSLNESSYYSCEVSPDGKWLLEHDRGGTNVMRLDGSHWRFIEDGGRWDNVQWLDDSKHWLNFFNGTNGHFIDYSLVTRYNLQLGRPKQALPDTRHDYDLPSEELLKTSFATSGVLLCYAAPVRSLHDHQEEDRHATQIVIRRRRLTSPRQPVRVHQFALPCAGRVVEAVFSPTRRRLSWLLWTSGRLTLYTSDLNGRRRSTIGSFACPCPEKSDMEGERSPAYLRWLPSGKRLSFVYQEVIYTVPAQ